MRVTKKIFSMYSIDFWLFIFIMASLTVLISYSNNLQAPETQSPPTGSVEEYLEPAGTREQDICLYIFSFATVGCVFLIQANKKRNASPLSWLALRAGEKFESKFSRAELNNYHACLLTLAALLFVYTAYTIGAFIIGRKAIVLAALLIVMTVILASFYMCVIRGLSEQMRYLLIGVCMTFPVAITLVAEDFNAGYSPNTYVWLITALAFSMLLLNRSASKLFFKLFACALFIGILCEIHFNPNIDFIKMISFVSNIFYAGFVIFAPLDFHMDRSLENHAVLVNMNRELKETQTQLIRREQMVTLGQLIAGVAHEINTPIGAIKASAEMLDTLDIGKLMKDAKRYGDDALDTLIAIVDMCTRSTKNMRSTTDIRRGRTQVRKFLESIDIKRADEICVSLAEMEICDIEKIETNMDMFRRDDIMDILISARALKPYITSMQSINYASNRVSKIIFSLKSFSHMNTTGEAHQFDIAQNIDNVLVLYHNQIKRGIEVIKQYDEDVPLLYGNVEELSQVWTNIIQNAIYAMSYVGRLIITIRNMGGKKVSVAFTDTGPGISPEHIDKLFVPFFTTKPLGEGSGLGLDICKKVIEKHNGDIKVESKPDQGATFTVTLPVTDQGKTMPDSGR